MILAGAGEARTERRYSLIGRRSGRKRGFREAERIVRALFDRGWLKVTVMAVCNSSAALRCLNVGTGEAVRLASSTRETTAAR